MAKVKLVTPIETMHGNIIRFCGRIDKIDKTIPLDPNCSIRKPTVNPNMNPLKNITVNINGSPTTERPSNINAIAVFKLFDSDK